VESAPQKNGGVETHSRRNLTKKGLRGKIALLTAVVLMTAVLVLSACGGKKVKRQSKPGI
jgi:hypothetical protein